MGEHISQEVGQKRVQGEEQWLGTETRSSWAELLNLPEFALYFKWVGGRGGEMRGGVHHAFFSGRL